MPDATDSLVQYLQGFGIPKEHATALTYKLLEPVDMKEALTRLYHQGGEREDAAREADRVLSTQAYLAQQGKEDPVYADHLKQAAAMIVRPNYVPKTEGKDRRPLSSSFSLLSNQGSDPSDPSGNLTPDPEYAKVRAAEADEAKHVRGHLPVSNNFQSGY